MAKHFGLNETLDVAKAGNDYTSVVTADGVHFNINGAQTDLAFADYQIPNIVANNVGVTLDVDGKLSIAEHKLPLVVRQGAARRPRRRDHPAIDPNAHEPQRAARRQGRLLRGWPGDQRRARVAVRLGGGAGTWTSACTAGLNFGSQHIYNQIAGIDASALEFDLTGTAKAVDTNSDHKADTMQTGKWTGTLSYSGTPAPLAAATFTGARM